MVDSNLNSVLPGLLGFQLPQAMDSLLERVLGIHDVRKVYSRIATATGIMSAMTAIATGRTSSVTTTADGDNRSILQDNGPAFDRGALFWFHALRHMYNDTSRKRNPVLMLYTPARSPNRTTSTLV